MPANNLLTPELIARKFLTQYYTVLNSSPKNLYQCYRQDASFLRQALNDSNAHAASGLLCIRRKINELGFVNTCTRIRSLHASRSSRDGIVIQVCGEQSCNGSEYLRFCQSFVLVQETPRKYLLQSDAFQYLDMVTVTFRAHKSRGLSSIATSGACTILNSTKSCPPHVLKDKHCRRELFPPLKSVASTRINSDMSSTWSNSTVNSTTRSWKHPHPFTSNHTCEPPYLKLEGPLYIYGVNLKYHSDSMQIYVANLPHDTCVDELRNLFGQYGRVVGVRIHCKSRVYDVKAPWFAFVGFDRKATVTNILHATNIGGWIIRLREFWSLRVEYKKPRPYIDNC